MCDFRNKMKSVTHTEWQKGWKIIRWTTDYHTEHWFTGSHFGVKITPKAQLHADKAPTHKNYTGFYLYTNDNKLKELKDWQIINQGCRMVRVLYKGKCVYGNGPAFLGGLSGVRAEFVKFQRLPRGLK